MTSTKKFFTFRKYPPCMKCTKYCINEYLTCFLCRKNFHRSCLKMTKKAFDNLAHSNSKFICSNRCYNSELPFFNSDNIDLMDFLFSDGKYPCGNCKRECTNHIACIRCSVCYKWYHHTCTKLSDMGFFDYYFFCSLSCEMYVFPFTACATESLVNDGIICAVNKKQNESKTVSDNQITADKSKKNLKSSKTLNYNPFLDIKCTYLLPKELKGDFFGEENSSLSIFHNNVRSVNKNISDVKKIFLKCDKLPDIITISETKLTASSSLPNLPGFNFENVNSPTAAGGVGIFISDHIEYVLRDDLRLNITGCEDIWIEVKLSTRSSHVKKIVVGSIYRHPGSQYNNFQESLDKTLTLLSRNDTKTVIVGDINIDLMKFNTTSKVTDYVHSILSQGFNLFIDKPTRVTSHSATCIDHVYSNLPVEDIESVILESDVSDHYSTLTKVHGLSVKNDNPDSFYRNTNLSPEQWEQFNSELEYTLACNLSLSQNDIDINYYANFITDTYKSLIKKYMPLKKKTRKQKHFSCKPWITSGIKASIDKKDELYRQSKIDPSSVPKYKAHSNMLKKLKDKAEIEYDRQKIAEYGADKSKTWRYINEIMKRKRKSKTSIKMVKDKNGDEVTDRDEICNCMNEHFSTIGKNMAEACPVCGKDPLDYLSKRVEENIELTETKRAEILELILSQDTKKACGYDEINNKIIQKTSLTAAPYLEVLFNLVMRKGIFPDCFKLAQVTPLFKGGDKSDLSSYRPISLLPALSKILEKIILVRMMFFLSEHDVLSQKQFGFRPKFTTE